MSEDADLVRVKKAAQALGEHFDTVHIFVTRHEPTVGGTIQVNWGAGNWYARFGHVDHWLMRTREADKERERLDARRESQEDDT